MLLTINFYAKKEGFVIVEYCITIFFELLEDPPKVMMYNGGSFLIVSWNIGDDS